MSFWSHNPELADEIFVDELIERLYDSPGECVICFGEEKFLEEADYYWVKKRFGEDFACDVALIAERNFFDGLCP